MTFNFQQKAMIHLMDIYPSILRTSRLFGNEFFFIQGRVVYDLQNRLRRPYGHRCLQSRTRS